MIDHVESQFWNDEPPLLPFVLLIQLYVQDLFLFDASKTLVAQCLLGKKKEKKKKKQTIYFCGVIIKKNKAWQKKERGEGGEGGEERVEETVEERRQKL